MGSKNPILIIKGPDINFKGGPLSKGHDMKPQNLHKSPPTKKRKSKATSL